jgi:hypothetical protein
VGAPGADPLGAPLPRLGRGNFRLGGGGIVVVVMKLCVIWRGGAMLRRGLVADGKRDTRRERANERSERECETSFIIFNT